MADKKKQGDAKGTWVRRKRERKHPRIRLAFKILFLLILVGVLGGMVYFYKMYGDDIISWRREASEKVEQSNKETFRSSETGFIYTNDKKVMAKLTGDKDAYYLDFDNIPQYVKDCFIVTEDRDYYEHDGVNFWSTAKAAMLLVESRMSGNRISRGGSTITQQLARKIYLYDDKTYERKVREMFYAIELEKKYTKDQILEFYINNVCFANAKYGIESASKAYFSKSVKDLNLAEIAFLCSIPNRPELYNPLTGYDNTIKRKDRILKQLLQENKITEAEYSDAVYTKIILKPAEAIKTQDYMTTFAINCATKLLMKQRGFEFHYVFDDDDEQKAYQKEYDIVYDECRTQLNNGGYKIYTSLDRNKQHELQKAVNDTLAGFTARNKDKIFKLQGAATCIDNSNGFVVAIVGGRKQKSTTGYSLNRAFQSHRQPGSCFKPLVVYTPCLERNYSPSSIVDDTRFKGGPKNSDGTYLGKIQLRRAVEKSKNVVAWRLFKELGPKVGLKYVLRMHFSKIVDSDYYPAASLGGLTNGASTVEMASAYATLANDGAFREPTCVTKITDADGNVIVQNTGTNRKEKQVYEKNAAREMTDILEGVLVRGTAAGKGLKNMHCAGKTGTTSDKKDGWFCGFTPYYSTAVWVGYDNPQSMDDLYGNTYPLTIWRTFMDVIHEDLEDKSFTASTGKKKNNYSNNNYNDDTSYNTPKETVEPDATEDYEDVNEGVPTEAPTKTQKPDVKVPKKTKAPVMGGTDDVGTEEIPDDVGDGE